MTNIQANKNEQLIADINAIKAAGITYTWRKYAGAWVPVVIKDGKRMTFVHCSTSGGAHDVAFQEAAKLARA